MLDSILDSKKSKLIRKTISLKCLISKNNLALSPTAYQIRGGWASEAPPKISRKESSLTPYFYIAFASKSIFQKAFLPSRLTSNVGLLPSYFVFNWMLSSIDGLLVNFKLPLWCPSWMVWLVGQLSWRLIDWTKLYSTVCSFYGQVEFLIFVGVGVYPSSQCKHDDNEW